MGKGVQYTESGAISVGAKGKYLESGSVDASGSKGLNTAAFGNSKITLAKGATLNITSAAAAPLTGSATQPIAALGSTPTDGSGTPSSNPATTTDTSGNSSNTTPPTSTGNWWDSIPGADSLVNFWTGLSTMQQLAAAAAGVLILWFIFHRRKSA